MSTQQHSGLVGMSRGTYLRLLVFFLAPAIIIYSTFSIYPLIATIINSLYLPAAGRQLPVQRARQLRHAALRRRRGPARSGTRSATTSIFFVIHMVVQNPIGLVLAALLSLPRLKLPRHLSHPDLHADHALGRGHRLHLAADPLAARGASPRCSCSSSAWAFSSRPGSARNRPPFSPYR